MPPHPPQNLRHPSLAKIRCFALFIWKDTLIYIINFCTLNFISYSSHTHIEPLLTISLLVQLRQYGHPRHAHFRYNNVAENKVNKLDLLTTLIQLLVLYLFAPKLSGKNVGKGKKLDHMIMFCKKFDFSLYS